MPRCSVNVVVGSGAWKGILSLSSVRGRHDVAYGSGREIVEKWEM